jgi:outer membrane cobalamin receptor
MIRQSGFFFLIATLLIYAMPAAAQGTAAPSAQQPSSGNTIGSVVDISGAMVPGADITVTARDGRTSTVKTDSDGNFDAGVVAARVRVASEGFETVTVEIDSGDPVRIVLRPVNFADSVVVTATRGAERLPSAASSTVLTSAELANMAAGALDDALRSTPGFTLFRRSSSRVANPTTQGVTLRGVSGSGSSRTLVLADGVPLNDPFGSWVYWNRIPLAAVERVEVVRGATGDLYGSGALGGVIQLLTVQPSRTRARATFDGGSHDTFRGSLFAAGEKDGWNGSGAYEGVRTDGVYVLAPEVRGAVDTRADSDYNTGFATFGKRGSNWHITGRGGWYAEDRNNGTVVQVNTTDWQQAALDAGGYIAGGMFEVHGVGSSQDYYQTFSAVAAATATAPARATERLTFEQFIDTSHRAVNAQWTKPLDKVTLIVGGDFRHTDSIQDEYRYTLVSGVNTKSGPFFSGGTERLAAGYARANVAASDALTIEVGLRADSWKSEPEDPSLPTKDSSYLSPRGAVAYRAGRYQMQASAYYANRTPTLNELHRPGDLDRRRGRRAGAVCASLASRHGLLQRSRRRHRQRDAVTDAATDHPAAPELRHDSRDRRRDRARLASLEHPERDRPDRVHVEPLPRLGGDAGDRRQLRAAGAEGTGRRRADLGRSALVHRGDASPVQRRTVRRRPQYAGVRARRLRRLGRDRQPRRGPRAECVPGGGEHPRHRIRHRAHAAALDRLAAHCPHRRQGHLAMI